ncbi:MAG: hypothetical protein LAQ30_19660 [Acidobacteriia bacterium]|nr:hypothetical protein [Terriglobia bacterium]
MDTKIAVAAPLILGLIPVLAFTQVRAQPHTTSYYDSSSNGVITQFVDGGYWKTIVTLVNLEVLPSSYTLKFYGDDGKPLQFQTTDGTGTSITGTLPSYGSHVIETSGTNPASTQGWALLQTNSRTIGGTVIFRQNVPGRNDYEASLPITAYYCDKRQMVPFEETTLSAGIGLVNTSSYQDLVVYVTLRGEDGKDFFEDNFTLKAYQHMAFRLRDRYPQVTGQRGVVEFGTTGSGLCVLGLRFGPNSFTSIMPLSSLNW